MKKIAFVWYGKSTFIQQDYNILQKHFEVETARYDPFKSIFKIIRTVKNADVAFCWFADVWSFIAVVSAKLFKKKSVVVVGGYDVECLREIGYGMCTKPFWRRWMRTFTLRHATTLLAVSEYTAQKMHPFIYKDAHKLKVVYNGVDTKYFLPKGIKENIVLTVVSSGDNDIIALKGLDKFIQVARYVSDATFVVIGLNQKDRYTLSKMNSSDNIKLIGKIAQSDLLQWYQKSKVYCQLSKVESFGMSLAEAMACGCVSVTTRVGGLIEVIGNEGYTVSCDMEEIVSRIEKALCAFPYEGYAACTHLLKKFSVEQREQKLVHILEDI